MSDLSVSGLTYTRSDFPLFSGLEFTLSRGEILQVAGQNGAGKTTLLRILAGLMLADEGQILWSGESILENRIGYQSDLAYLGHHNGIKEDSTVLENLQLAQSLFFAQGRISITQALETVKLSGFEYRLCRTLSAGQKRRVALARVLISPARLWILDEPFTAIDQAGVSELEQLTQAHASTGGMVILTSHHALGLSDFRVINLSDDRQDEQSLLQEAQA